MKTQKDQAQKSHQWLSRDIFKAVALRAPGGFSTHSREKQSFLFLK